jgi:putative transcriptional regulator
MITPPSDEILLKYSAGTLDPALRLLVQRHLELSPQTRLRLADFDQFGGLMLASETEMSMTAGSLDRALARIAATQPEANDALEWPPLGSLNWRWIGPGRSLANVEIPGSTLKAYALKIAPGKAMLQHSHADREWTLIVQGAYRDETGEFHTGAFIEEDESTLHSPVAFGDAECICLAVMSGPLTSPSMMGTFARWMMR